ncbi:hypothetical protein [Shewanella gaetbuli]|uniref:Uncharacterized protein n=1 Tax=Shewanella gaetbuli TaxID=220752 RepID=A0A9X2CL81_9GAMM|nr:hypothetical protein [Shewanella gaetbuli]MCL1142429.1 hypothetical protein [Shewanella gaetbuli]
MTEKVIINGIYETSKMRVEITDTQVIKTFKQSSHSKKRYLREKSSLQMLSGKSGFPELISTNDDIKQIVMSKLPGTRPESLSAVQALQLRTLVDSMLLSGIARHAIPIRDLIVDDNGTLHMVDFERVSIKSFASTPFWYVAKWVSLYHLIRLINQFQPDSLTVKEKKLLNIANAIRNVLQKLKPLRDKIFK